MNKIFYVEWTRFDPYWGQASTGYTYSCDKTKLVELLAKNENTEYTGPTPKPSQIRCGLASDGLVRELKRNQDMMTVPWEYHHKGFIGEYDHLQYLQ